MGMRIPKPFFRQQTQSWYVQLGKRQVNLGKDEGKAKAKYKLLLAGQADEPGEALQVIAVLMLFKEWSEKHDSAETYKFYKRHLDSFIRFIGPSVNVADLKKRHVYQWIDGPDYSGPGRSDNYRRNAMRSVQRAFNWAVEMEYLDSMPLAKLKKPAYTSRTEIISPEQWEELEEALCNNGEAGRNFLDLITLMRQTGCRPHEARTAEARHLDSKSKCLVFEREKSKGKKVQRVVPLTNLAFELCQRKAKANPTGPLFCNSLGRPWNRRSIIKWFARLDGTRYKTKSDKRANFHTSAYVIRHTWATEALERGVDAVKIAKMMGHTDVTMLMKTYGHIEKKSESMREAMQQAVGVKRTKPHAA